MGLTWKRIRSGEWVGRDGDLTYTIRQSSGSKFHVSRTLDRISIATLRALFLRKSDGGGRCKRASRRTDSFRKSERHKRSWVQPSTRARVAVPLDPQRHLEGSAVLVLTSPACAGHGRRSLRRNGGSGAGCFPSMVGASPLRFLDPTRRLIPAPTPSQCLQGGFSVRIIAVSTRSVPHDQLCANVQAHRMPGGIGSI